MEIKSTQSVNNVPATIIRYVFKIFVAWLFYTYTFLTIYSEVLIFVTNFTYIHKNINLSMYF